MKKSLVIFTEKRNNPKPVYLTIYHLEVLYHARLSLDFNVEGLRLRGTDFVPIYKLT